MPVLRWRRYVHSACEPDLWDVSRSDGPSNPVGNTTEGERLKTRDPHQIAWDTRSGLNIFPTEKSHRHLITPLIKKMDSLRAIYPFGLASANVSMGWLLYQLSKPGWGGLLVMIGLFVILTLIGSAISECQSASERSV
jgi:hypothetical protein